ncbi:GntR family transcriptional regulator [Streptomyces rhizosphaerihabitans]|uniref:GntR family transcriptional regulator n=1 Tax=Streptomyces rhizosphaerihabitans TaxID=1266770 RepID=UPI0021BED413|nr:GntR family transcriptional regulator [Streptomyces rhizosphaerihabitans]MCT9008318.1 GntR family transcriptional regulator [Streptomyces rhizosphaerihabitans]
MAYEVAAPKYVRLAQTLQGRIEDGTYPPGSRVPSENQLVQAFGMSRPTVVRALELLKRDGWLESRQGFGTIVRGRPEVAEQKVQRGREVLDRQEDRTPGRLVEVCQVPVPPRVAGLLGVPRKTRVLLRRLLIEADGEPVELSSSYFPVGLAEGTELADSALLTEGLRAHLEARKKVRFDHVTERVSARIPSKEEADLLEMPEGEPVLAVLVLACDATGQALQVTDVLLPADRQELEETYRLG